MAEKIRVLYAEEDPRDADLTMTYFEQAAPHLELEVVDTGRKFLARLNEAKYDVVMVDYRLPDMDGIAVLRELAEKADAPPAVMVTGMGDEELVIQALRLGACDYVPKQGDYVRGLPAVLENAVGEQRRLAEQGYVPGRRQRHVLYVEHDNADIDLTVKHFAEAAPHVSVEVVRSSVRALSRLREERFDLVLADLRMPDMSALELLREARRAGGPLVPFIVITGRGDEAAAVAALKLGAYDYIVKRENYLTQLPYAIDNAIARSQVAGTNGRLHAELEQRKRAEEENARLLNAVRNERQRMADIIASVHGVVWESSGPPDNPGLTMQFISSYVETMLGYSVQQWLSTPGFWLSIVHPEDRDRVTRELAGFFQSGKGGILQFREIAKDRRVVWVEVHVTVVFDEQKKPVGLRGVAVDITASKEAERVRAQLEEQLRHAQRMEAIGRLAGGVAHDFNNILTAINGYAELMLEDIGPGDPLRASLNEIRKAGDRAAELTHQLLAFSRSQMLEPRELDLNALVRDDSKLFKRLLGEDIELVTILDPELGHIRADAGQIHQVMLNIAVNARDAMPHGGKLTIETRNITIDQERAQADPSVPQNSYVKLLMSDTGVGMDAETQSHIFEPFFTTKEQGKGTGLGLSLVYGIVRQSGGSISVSSEPGHGTTFRIYLPRIEEHAVEAPSKRAELERVRGSETILVAEDEEAVRKLTCQILRGCGYQVIEAANAGEALLAAEKLQEPIHLLVADVVMPRMGGRELADRLRRLRPEVRVLYMSGYTDAIVRGEFLESGTFFIQKPFTPTALAQKVRGILDQEISKHAP